MYLITRMKMSYDEEVGVLWIRLSQHGIEESDEVQPGMIFDYDAAGNIVGIEIHAASQRVDNPREVETETTSSTTQQQQINELRVDTVTNTTTNDVAATRRAAS